VTYLWYRIEHFTFEYRGQIHRTNRGVSGKMHCAHLGQRNQDRGQI
jgi:hypothetical protein